MAKASKGSTSTASRVKELPWAAMIGALLAIGRRWRALSEKERSHLLQLVRESGVRPDRLSPKQRRELRGLLIKLDIRGMTADLARLTRATGKRRRWRTS